MIRAAGLLEFAAVAGLLFAAGLASTTLALGAPAGNAQTAEHTIVGGPAGGTPGLAYEDIVAKVTAEGFRHVFSVEREHALFEIKAIDPEGRKVELFMNPKTGKILRNPKTGKPIVEILTQ